MYLISQVSCLTKKQDNEALNAECAQRLIEDEHLPLGDTVMVFIWPSCQGCIGDTKSFVRRISKKVPMVIVAKRAVRGFLQKMKLLDNLTATLDYRTYRNCFESGMLYFVVVSSDELTIVNKEIFMDYVAEH